MTWASSEIEQLEVDSLVPYARNARTHTASQVSQIAASIREFGFTNPVLIDGDGTILAGHGRVMAAQKLKLKTVPCIRLPLKGSAAKAYILADNRLAELAGWDDEMLKAELVDLKEAGIDMDLIGWSTEDLGEIFAADGGLDIPGSEKASALALVGVTIAEPSHVVESGDIYELGEHLLLCCSVIEDWSVWAKFLKPGTIFVPYPSPYAPLSDRAEEDRLVMVQPSSYLCGHMLDRWVDVHGVEPVKV